MEQLVPYQQPSGIGKYLDSAVTILAKFGIKPAEDEAARMAGLLQDVDDVSPEKVTAIAQVLQYASSFNALVRDQVQDMTVSDRYAAISSRFGSVQSDAKTLVSQLDDGKVDFREKVANLYMKLTRGSIDERFEEITDTFRDVQKTTKDQLDREDTILEAYSSFRSAAKEGAALAYEVAELQSQRVAAARGELELTSKALENASQEDKAAYARLQLARDQALTKLKDEENKHQLINDVAQNLEISYNVGETVMAKLGQTHDVKQALYRRSVIFLSTHEHTLTALGATMTSQLGLNEATLANDAMADGINQSLETAAELSGKLEGKARESAYGPMVRAESLKKLVDAVVAYQTESDSEIARLKAESTSNAEEIARIVEDGRQRVLASIRNYNGEPTLEQRV